MVKASVQKHSKALYASVQNFGLPLTPQFGHSGAFSPSHRYRQSSTSLQDEIKQFTEAVSKAFKSAGYGVEAVDSSVDAKNYVTWQRAMVQGPERLNIDEK